MSVHEACYRWLASTVVAISLCAPGVALAQSPSAPAPGGVAGTQAAQNPDTPRDPHDKDRDEQKKDRDDQKVPTVRETVDVVGKAPSEKLSLEEPAPTASRLDLPVREIPATVTIVDRATIESRGSTDTQAMLSAVPGMTAAAPPGSAGSVWYRGFGTSQITQLFNGITVQYDAIAGRPVDSFIYNQVEVIGGPSTFLFGAGAVGGSINYITKLPTLARDSVDARVGIGSYNTSELSVGANRRFGSGAVKNVVRADVSRTYSNGAIDGNERTGLTTALSLLTDFNRKFSHTVAAEYQREHVDSPYWGTPVLNPTVGELAVDPATRFKNYNANDGLYEQTVWWGRSILEYRPSASTSVRSTLYHYDALRDYRNVEVYRYTPDNASVIRSSPLLQRHDQTLTGNRVEFQQKGHVGPLTSDWAAGFDYSVNQQTRFPLSLTLNVSTVNPLNFTTNSFWAVPGMVPGFNPDRTDDVTTLAFFVENRTKLGGGVSLVTGLRRDRIDLEVTNHRTVTATDPAYFKNTYQPTTGRAGLSYEVTRAANVYVQYSTAADPPAGILTTANFSQVRDFDLTTGRQVEVGTKFDFLGGRGSATAAAYRIVRKNLAITDPNTPSLTLPVGQQSSRGVDLSASVRAERRLLVQGNVAFVDATFDDFLENVSGVATSRAGNRPTGVPTRVANAWITYTPAPRWDASVDARFVGSRFANTANTQWAAGYTVFGAALTHRLSAKAQVTARVRNLTDEVYAVAVTGTPLLFLGPPRTVDLTLKLGL